MMTIRKIGHCCLDIDADGVRILTDPGAWTTAQNDLRNISVLLITHEHQDHFHVQSIQAIRQKNPEIRIYTNEAVGTLLDAQQIPWNKLEDGERTTIGAVSIDAYGNEHAEIHSSVPRVQNTGFCIAEQFFYPGDALIVPPRAVDLLALPVVGPWLKLGEALAYAEHVHPKHCFPVHDGMLSIIGPFHMLPQRYLPTRGIEFTPLVAGQSLTFSA